jgi:uncharacterized protein (TIGR02680 family)
VVTDQLFTTSTALPAPAPAERLGRYTLHRAGIVNVWQYDRTELLFAGGRILMRGSNGAGKSKALEVLLPFLLDGDTRLIDATGRDRTTVRWLMTDGREPGNHVGYVWLELRFTEEEGPGGELHDRYVTIGAGLKASTTTQQSATWFFITGDHRVGESLHLGNELSIDRLRDAIGADAVTQAGAEHRRRVASLLFGVHSEARYQSLIHLLHRLRDPNIGNRVDAGELAAVLTDALPPLSDGAIDKAAERFDTLDQIREQLEGLERTAAALERFLVDYSGYAKTRLAERANAVVSAGGEERRAERERARLGEEVLRVAAALADAEAGVALLRQDADRAAAEVAALRSSEEYQHHRQLGDRRGAVTAKASEAATAAEAAAGRAMIAGDLARDLERAGQRVEAVARVLLDARAVLERDAAGARLDAAIVPHDAGGIPAAEIVATGRRRAAERVRVLAAAAARLALEAERFEEQAARSESELAERHRDLAAARSHWEEETEAWSIAMSDWAGQALPAVLHPEIGATADVAALVELLDGIDEAASEEVLAEAAALARAALEPARHGARELEAAARARHDSASATLAVLEAEHSVLEAEEEARPLRSRFSDAERDPVAGAPFYELVEVAPGLGPVELAGLEAALEASGLLDAWVSAEGVLVDPASHEIVWRAETAVLAAGEPSLADVLVASDERVTRLLRSIGLGERAGGAFVTTGGRWSLPPLAGSWAKPDSEFLGAPARRATRERRLADLAQRIAVQRAAAEAAAARLGEVREASKQLELMASGVPTDAAVRSALAETGAAERAEAGARARYGDDRRVAADARGREAIARAELTHTAAADTLPVAPDELDVVVASARDLSSGLGRWKRDWEDHAARLAEVAELTRRHEDSTAAADAALRRADDLATELDRDTTALRTLEEAVGASVEAVLRQIDAASRREQEATRAQPGAQHEVTRLADARGRATSQYEESGRQLAAAASAFALADNRLATALGLPGVAEAALGRSAPGEDATGESAAGERAAAEHEASVASGGAQAASDLLERIGSFAPVSDGTILNRVLGLQPALGSGYEVVDDETDGVKFVLIADDAGRQPLPSVAARTSAEAARARERLAAGERETIERFLLGELGEEVRERLLEAHDLIRSANRALGSVRSSHGIGARLDWSLDDEASAGAREATRLLVMSPRSAEEDVALRDGLMAMIRAERERDPVAGYGQHLRIALDYRRWHRFSVRVTNEARPGSERVLSSRLGLSQGEQRVLSYLALFAAAAAHFDTLGKGCPRLLLLDDAFAKVDEPTHGRLLRLLVDLDLDFMITSERMWGCFAEVPSLEIYEALRDPSTPGVALVHFHWDGHERHLVGI